MTTYHLLKSKLITTAHKDTADNLDAINRVITSLNTKQKIPDPMPRFVTECQ